MLITLLLAILVQPSTIFAWSIPKAIHGVDNRHEAYSYPDKTIRLQAHAIAAKVKKHALHKSLFHKGEYSFAKKTLGQTYNFCTHQKFEQQRVLASCTAFLVTPDTLITAGHCVKKKNACKNNYWVFGVTNKTKRIKKENVYRCKKLIAQSFSKDKKLDDYAIIKLERKVTGRKPLVVDLDPVITEHSAVYMIGHPIRLPIKVTDNAETKSIFARYFTTNLDIFSGNSGSPVFDKQTGKVIGLAVRAVHGYHKERGCFKLVTLPQDAEQDVILKLGEIPAIRHLLQ